MYGRTRGDRAKGQGEGIENKWVRDSAIFRWCRVFRLADSALSSALFSSTDPQFPHPTFSALCFSSARREWPILLVAMGSSVWNETNRNGTGIRSNIDGGTRLEYL